MDLERAMWLVASPLAVHLSEPDLTRAVRVALLDLLAGRPVPGLAAGETEALRTWLGETYGGESDPGGALYEALLGRRLETGPTGSVSVRKAARDHRATGAYYTQETVVQYLLGRARRYMPEPRSVIDPACGSGAFLAGARRTYGTLTRLTGLDSDATALALCRSNVPEASLHLADALLSTVPGGYDLCVGNPPYISSGLRGAAPHDAARQNALRQRFPHTSQYKLNTYPLFMERGLELLREGGVLGYVIPDSFLSGRFFAGTRRLLLAHTLLEVTLVCEDFWQHGRVGQTVILFVRKGPPPAGHHVHISVCRSVADLARAPETSVPVNELVWGPLQRFRLIPDSSERSTIAAMEAARNSLPLGTLLTTYSGLIARRGQESLLRSANPGYKGPWGRLLRSGREIDRYRLAWAGEEVCLDPALIKSGGHLPYYAGPKLLLRQTADSLRAVYDPQGFYCLNNIHLLVPKQPDVDLRALLGLINSGPVNRYYRAMTMETGRLYAQVDLDLLESIPVPTLSPATVSRLLALVRVRESAAPEEAALLECAIDGLVTGAYGLT